MTPEYDIIVIGGRVAGSVVSTLLGGRGHKILVLDRAKFPSDTLSTHFFRDPAFKVFQQMGVLDRIYDLAPKLVNNFNDVDGHVFTETVEGSDGPSHHICIRRFTLDDILVRRMKQEKGVTVKEGATADEIHFQDGGGVVVEWVEGGNRFEAKAKAVIGADGINSFVAKAVQPAVERSEPVHRAMYYAYYKNLKPQPGPAAEFHYRGNHLVYVFPSDGGMTLIAVSVPISEFAEFKKGPEARLDAELQAMPQLVERWRKAGRAGPVRGTGTISGYQRIPYGPGWALVGDSGQLMDPWSGQGIDQATTHASFMADALDSWLSGKQSWEEAMKGYHQRRNEFSKKAFERTCKYAPDLRVMTMGALKKRGLA